jgi:hypothetical protein
MRIKQKNHNSKRIPITIIALLLTFTYGVSAFVFKLPPFSTQDTPLKSVNEVNLDSATDDQKSAGTKAKEEFNSTHYNTETTDQQTSESKRNVEVLISSMNQNAETLIIATSVYTLNNDGKCDMKLSRTGSNDVIGQVKTYKLTTYSSCEDFSINTSELEKGLWDITVNYTSTIEQGSISSQVTIR